MSHWRYGIVLILLSMLMVVGLGSRATADTSANISRSYYTTSTISDGSLVSLAPQQAGYIQPADVDNGARLLGVAVAVQDSLVAIDATSTTVQVAITGTASTLVSNVNGDIKVGDQVSVSPFAGVGMEAGAGDRIIGVAQTAFQPTAANATTEAVKDKNGKTHQIHVGYIRLTIAIGNGSGTGAGGSQANFLQRLIKSLTGHTISTVRILLSLLVGLIAIVSMITLLYASIHGSIISVGRNPLAKTAIFRTLTSVMFMALITMGVACVTIYYLLR